MGDEQGNRQYIRAKDVAIKTATVAVRVITINDKQMTLAVFRQLPIEHFMIMAGAWAHHQEDIWGWVNYCPKDCEWQDTEPHLHVIWLENDKLVRTDFAESDTRRYFPDVDGGQACYHTEPCEEPNPFLARVYWSIEHLSGQLYIAI